MIAFASVSSIDSENLDSVNVLSKVFKKFELNVIIEFLIASFNASGVLVVFLGSYFTLLETKRNMKSGSTTSTSTPIIPFGFKTSSIILNFSVSDIKKFAFGLNETNT